MFNCRILTVFVAICLLPEFISMKPLVLTDKTWKDMLCGQWMVEFYAPWCPSCQQFEPIWNDFAKALASKEINVASIDINDYPSLSGRFRISVLPTIYYVRDGVFRQFDGERSLDGLKKYVENQEWQRTDPVPSYVAPNSIPMSLISAIFDMSVLVKDAYTTLQEKYSWPSWLIYIFFTAIVIVVGLFLGFGVLMIIDYCVTGIVKDDDDNIPDDSKDGEDLDENDSQKLTKSKKSMNSIPKIVASSTPQRPTKKTSPNIELQDDEPLINDVLAGDNDDSEGLNAFDMAQATDEDDQTTAHFSTRQRRTTKK